MPRAAREGIDNSPPSVDRSPAAYLGHRQPASSQSAATFDASRRPSSAAASFLPPLSSRHLRTLFRSPPPLPCARKTRYPLYVRFFIFFWAGLAKTVSRPTFSCTAYRASTSTNRTAVGPALAATPLSVRSLLPSGEASIRQSLWTRHPQRSVSIAFSTSRSTDRLFSTHTALQPDGVQPTGLPPAYQLELSTSQHMCRHVTDVLHACDAALVPYVLANPSSRHNRSFLGGILIDSVGRSDRHGSLWTTTAIAAFVRQAATRAACITFAQCSLGATVQGYTTLLFSSTLQLQDSLGQLGQYWCAHRDERHGDPPALAPSTRGLAATPLRDPFSRHSRDRLVQAVRHIPSQGHRRRGGPSRSPDSHPHLVAAALA